MTSLQAWRLGTIVHGEFVPNGMKTKRRDKRDQHLNAAPDNAAWECWDDGCCESYAHTADGREVFVTHGR